MIGVSFSHDFLQIFVKLIVNRVKVECSSRDRNRPGRKETFVIGLAFFVGPFFGFSILFLL